MNIDDLVAGLERAGDALEYDLCPEGADAVGQAIDVIRSLDATENRVVHEVGAVLMRYGADSDASMDEWALAEFLWGALRCHNASLAVEKRLETP